MSNEDLQKSYIEKINQYLPTVDFIKLDKSCNSKDNSYAKELLKKFHDIFVEVYGTNYLDSEHEFVDVPAVIQGRQSGHIGVGIVTLDIQSSGEHWGTFFFTPKGVINQDGEKMTAADSKYLSSTYIPYDYWYTVSIERDHHVDFDNMPEKIADMVNVCYPGQPEMKMEP